MPVTSRWAPPLYGATFGVVEMAGTVHARIVNRTVLIAEDNELSERVFREWLNSRGYMTLRARDGREALDLVRQHRPGLIVMDADLPVISGLEVARAVKQDAELKSIPIIGITAYGTRSEVDEIQGVGCDACITRPLSAGKFMETVRRFLG
jgi:two-component system cell cycle response regulator DivK